MEDEKVLEAEGKALLKDLEMENGKPVILSRFGFHIADVDGKKLLVASTLEELAEQLAKHEGRNSEDVINELKDRVRRPACGGTGPFNCYPYNGCKRCRAKYIGNGYYSCGCIGT